MKTKTVLPLLIVAFISTTLALFSSGCGENLTVEKELTVEEVAEQIQQKEGNIKD
jgi:outer membrane lipoprotein-sorting protein